MGKGGHGRGGSHHSSNDQRSNSMNPNNSSYQSSMDNRSDQMNPNNEVYDLSRGNLNYDDDLYEENLIEDNNIIEIKNNYNIWVNTFVNNKKELEKMIRKSTKYDMKEKDLMIELINLGYQQIMENEYKNFKERIDLLK